MKKNNLNPIFKNILEKHFPEPKEPEKPSDYCMIGLSTCPHCGWSNDYPVSGCKRCHSSFVS